MCTSSKLKAETHTDSAGSRTSTWRTGSEHEDAASFTDVSGGSLQQALFSSRSTKLLLAFSDSNACSIHLSHQLPSNACHGINCSPHNDGKEGNTTQIVLVATLEAHLPKGCGRHTHGGRCLQSTMLGVRDLIGIGPELTHQQTTI